MNDKDVVFTLTVEDVQAVADHQLGRLLTEKEVELFKFQIDNHLKWWDATFYCIEQVVAKGE